MSAQYTYEQIANDYRLWVEYVDTDSNMTEAEFNALPVEKKVAIQVDAFGPENAPKFQIFHSEYRYGRKDIIDTREEGPEGGYDTKEEAMAAMQVMQNQAKRDGQDDYADALNIQQTNA